MPKPGVYRRVTRTMPVAGTVLPLLVLECGRNVLAKASKYPRRPRCPECSRAARNPVPVPNTDALNQQIHELRERVLRLEADLTALREAVRGLRTALGEPEVKEPPPKVHWDAAASIKQAAEG